MYVCISYLKNLPNKNIVNHKSTGACTVPKDPSLQRPNKGQAKSASYFLGFVRKKYQV